MKWITQAVSSVSKHIHAWSFWTWAARVADPWSKWAQVLAVVGAAVWAVYTFNLFGASTIAPTLRVSTSVLPYDPEHGLLVVRVTVGNVGKVPVEIDDQPLSITIKELPPHREAGYVNRDELKPLYVAKNILARYVGGYEVDPGVAFDEVETFVVDAGKTYVVEATLTLDKSSDIGMPDVVYVPAIQQPPGKSKER